MTTREYYLIDAADQFPGTLNQADFVDAIANMNESEWRELNAALVEYNGAFVDLIIRKSICRQYATSIEKVAESAYEAHEESAREDELERRYEAKREAA